MQVSLETREGLERVLSISVPADRVDVEVNKRISDYAKQAKIDGFRPGKVPISVVKQRVGDSLRNEVVADVMKETMFDAIKQESLDIAGFPEIEPKLNEPGKPLEYLVKVEIMPSFDIKELTGIEIEKIECDINSKDVDLMIESMRKQHADWKEVNRKSKNDDKVIIDFLGKIDGEPFAGGESKDFELVLGSKQMIEGFEDAIVGMGINEERTIDVTFPAEYHSKELAGKNAQFDIKVSKVQEPILPEVDEAFFKRFNCTNLEDFKKQVEETMAKELRTRILGDYKEKVTKKMAEVNEITLPRVMIVEEINRLKRQALQQFGIQDSQKVNLSILPDDMFKEQAEHRVKLGLLMSKIIDGKALKADPEVVKNRVRELSESYDQPDEVFNWYYQDPRRVSQIEAIVLEEAVIDEMAKSATVKIVKRSYNDVINPSQA